ncbi:Lipase [uncultured Desulfobacterium sp.]|uniref:Lipase n=1 Tax=uncultured Desulfobacterium sp. TaxID=201089 RepID=A0A445MVC8_9BACT|nr:Lipase [uncultured Desulfobacterium sp.]
MSFPIILAHGITPFDKIIFPFFKRDNSDDDRFHYFKKIRSSLKRHGFEVFHARVNWAGEVKRRAEDLKDQITTITAGFTKWPKVHIIAHSMGGLDSRWMIYNYRMQDRIASLTTIGTPHLGSSYGDHGVKTAKWLIDGLGWLGINIRGFRDLTRKACEEFNRNTLDFEETNGVIYQTIAGVQTIDRIFLPLQRSASIVLKEEGENDGLVSLRSAMWKEKYFIRNIEADHLNEIGWWSNGQARPGFDRTQFEEWIQGVYLDIARGLND